MKHILGIILMSIIIVGGAAFFIFNADYAKLSGMVVENTIQKSSANLSEENAVLKINESEKILEEMKKNNFSTQYIEDQLKEARMALQQARYAEILRGNGSVKDKEEANKYLNIISWKNITYSKVIIYTNNIIERRNKAYEIYDKLYVGKQRINSETKSEIKELIGNAEKSFYEDKYVEAEELIAQFNNAFEKEQEQASNLTIIKQGAKNIFQRYWIGIILFLIILSVSSYFSFKKIQINILKRKIKKLEIEEKILNKLERKTQEERFKENKISEAVYNIRMKKYQEKINSIREELPVLKSKFSKLSKKN